MEKDNKNLLGENVIVFGRFIPESRIDIVLNHDKELGLGSQIGLKGKIILTYPSYPNLLKEDECVVKFDIGVDLIVPTEDCCREYIPDGIVKNTNKN